MNTFRKWISSGLINLGGFVSVSIMFGGFALHVFTILYAYRASGFLAALLSFAAPGIAQLYWWGNAWYATGDFINAFSYYVLVYLGWAVAAFILVMLGSAIAPEET